MKLICEVLEDKLEYVTEAKDNGDKAYKIKGVFMQGEIKNRNKCNKQYNNNGQNNCGLAGRRRRSNKQL